MTSLIVLGASVRAAALSARRAGYEPYAIDQYGDRDLAANGPSVKIQHYPEGCLPALAAAPQAPWLYTGGLENHPRLVDRLVALRPLLGNGGQVLNVARDLRTLCAAAHEAGCKFPRTREAAGVFGDEAPSGSQSRWLLKRRRSSGGLHVAMQERSEPARPKRGCYQQQYVVGEPASAVFVAAGGRAALLGITRQLLGAEYGLDRPFVYVGSVGPLATTPIETQRLLALSGKLAERCRLTGLFNVDFLRTGSDIWAIELNPRYSASIEVLERATGIRAIEQHLLACQANQLPGSFAPGGEKFAGKRIVYAPADVSIGAPLGDWVTALNAGTVEPLAADLPRVGERFTRGSPVLTVLAEAGSLADVESQLGQRAAAARSLLLP